MLFIKIALFSVIAICIISILTMSADAHEHGKLFDRFEDD